MSEDEDYLSDKFLVDTSTIPSVPKTYAQIRKEAEKKAKLKNEQNKLKSRRQRELESREEGLSKSLFERAKEEEEAGLTTPSSKALSMMLKMGFKPGQSLGKVEEITTKPLETPHRSESPLYDSSEASTSKEQRSVAEKDSHHKVEPLPLNEWGGKKGIGLGKRARSPTSAERVAKIAKMAEETLHRDYHDRARQEYEERRAEGKLGPAQRTCVTLDEQAEKSFNVLWLNPNSPDSFPSGLVDALTIRGYQRIRHDQKEEPIHVRLRRQMQEDALEPLSNSEAPLTIARPSIETFSSDIIEEAIQFLCLQAQDRLELVLSYLRSSYSYCFWCGVQYENAEAMENQCPGSNEEAHD